MKKINHLVFFELIDNEAIPIVKNELLKLSGLSYHDTFEVIENYIHNKSKGSLVLICTFKNDDELHNYMKDSIHLKVIKNTQPYIKNKNVFDYYI